MIALGFASYPPWTRGRVSLASKRTGEQDSCSPDLFCFNWREIAHSPRLALDAQKACIQDGRQE